MKAILIIDDSEAARASLKFSLEMKKYHVLTSSTGEEALKILNDNDDISLIITDINMPGIGGVELIKRIKQDTKTRQIPVVVLTTAEDKGKEALHIGASAFIMKSSNSAEEILRFVSKYVQ
jgi:two-component system chemotaxis response regulator CheY